MVISPYLNCGKDMDLWFEQPNNRFMFSCVQHGLETGNQTMGHGFLLWRAKGRKAYQTTRQKWPMARSQHAKPPSHWHRHADFRSRQSNAPQVIPHLMGLVPAKINQRTTLQAVAFGVITRIALINQRRANANSLACPS
jgi:hypothetical protein